MILIYFFQNFQDIDVGFERTKMDIEARSMAKKDQMTGKVHESNM